MQCTGAEVSLKSPRRCWPCDGVRGKPPLCTGPPKAAVPQQPERTSFVSWCIRLSAVTLPLALTDFGPPPFPFHPAGSPSPLLAISRGKAAPELLSRRRFPQPLRCICFVPLAFCPRCQPRLLVVEDGEDAGKGIKVCLTLPLCLFHCMAQMSVMVGLRLLHTSLESIANPEDPECESEGWVLENNLKDTLKSALESLKKIGKFNQVEADAEGAEGEEGGKTPAITTVSWASNWCGLFIREKLKKPESCEYLHFKSYVSTIRIHISMRAFFFCTWEHTT